VLFDLVHHREGPCTGNHMGHIHVRVLITYYAVLEPKKSVVNCDGNIVDIYFGVLLKTGDLTFVKEEASEKLGVARIVDSIHKVVAVIKMNKESIKNFTELAVNALPTVVKEPIIGWMPILDDHFIMNKEVYQFKWLIVIPAYRIKSIAMVKKYDVLKGQSADIFGMKNTYVLWFR
jgi:hypothetical protein